MSLPDAVAPPQSVDCVLDLEQLPGEAQALVCSSASTPACPAYALLAAVSKSWAAVAAEHLHFSGGTIKLVLPFDKDAVLEQQAPTEERLLNLALWLQRYGPSLTCLGIHFEGVWPCNDFCAYGRSWGVSSIIEALAAAAAAAASAPQGLRLQCLRLPAFGSAACQDITNTLGGCQQLRELRLGSTSGAGTCCAMDYLGGGRIREVAAALRQLTQLTTLHLHFGTFKRDYHDDDMAEVDLNHLFQALPSNLGMLTMAYNFNGIDASKPCLHTSSLQHLVSLKYLGLPRAMVVTSSGEAGADLAPLTALTFLDAPGALRPSGRALLAAPNLRGVWAGWGWPLGLQDLADKKMVRFLSLIMGPFSGSDAAHALCQLPQLTHLTLLLDDGRSSVPSGDDVAWLTALSSLTGLRSLRPAQLEG